MFCEPKISVSYHHAVVGILTARADAAEKEQKLTLEDLKKMTAELNAMSKSMSEQSDLIDIQLKQITELNAKLLEYEKEDPDMSIYEEPDTGCESEEEVRPKELDTINNCAMLWGTAAGVMILLSTLSLSHVTTHNQNDLLRDSLHSV